MRPCSQSLRMLGMVATTLVSDATSNTVSSVIGSTLGTSAREPVARAYSTRSPWPTRTTTPGTSTAVTASLAARSTADHGATAESTGRVSTTPPAPARRNPKRLSATMRAITRLMISARSMISTRSRAAPENGRWTCYDSRVMQRIFVAGATGFVGRSVVRALLARGFLVRWLVRHGSERLLKGVESIDRVPGDVLRPEGLVACAEGCAAIVNLGGIIREHRARGVTFERLHVQATANLLRVAREAGVKRYVQMSALGARPDARSSYHRTKSRAEEAVRDSGLQWTIFRPSIIFGPGDAF